MPLKLGSSRRNKKTARPSRMMREATLQPHALNATPQLLHIDDDPSFCRLTAYELRSRGYQIESLSDPTVALEEVRRIQPAVILLDVCMEGRSGLQVLRDLQAIDRGIQVVMMTSLVSEKTLVNARSMGAVGCLFKPIEDWQQLSNLIDGALERNRLWRQAMNRIKEDEFSA